MAALGARECEDIRTCVDLGKPQGYVALFEKPNNMLSGATQRAHRALQRVRSN